MPSGVSAGPSSVVERLGSRSAGSERRAISRWRQGQRGARRARRGGPGACAGRPCGEAPRQDPREWGVATSLISVGHGTLAEDEFVEVLRGAGVESLIDVRTAPGSRRHPHFRREAMEQWVADAGIVYRWEPRLGGLRKPAPDSPNAALRHSGFRAYADHMATTDFT